ncbi:hypothetical protein A5623_24600 [Mycobacterium colombiense]|uniref:Uncharacterized protein n=1 Tax=Mycobacterium colombiense TaxID=339268 RepID=A0A853LX57_9MYCO|nr:hypothetical protein A5623_24600 [Mycobacterium colombiense]OBJ58616.1 hypothetical protein A5628_13580 [Mycobacterium colombiense]
MRLLRGLPGAVLWILAAVLGLVGVLLCATIILLPLGIPLVKIAGRLFCRSVRLMLPHGLAHPVDDLTKQADKDARSVSSAVSEAADHATKKGRKLGTAASDTLGGAAKKGRKVARKQAKNLA